VNFPFTIGRSLAPESIHRRPAGSVTRAVLEALWADLPTTTVVIANGELSALRRVATLATEGVAPADLFGVRGHSDWTRSAKGG
jgi:hypothetical protein